VLTRIITALVLAPLALAGIYFLDLTVFAMAVAAIIALASYEWAGLVLATPTGVNSTGENNANENNGGIGITSAVLFVGTTLAVCAFLWSRPDLQSKWLLVSSVCWAWAIVEVLIYPKQITAVAENGRRGNMRWILFGLVVLPGAWAAMLLLKDRDPNLLVMVCFLVWGADAGAYFVGKAIGQRKLAPKVSPGKTWEGALGGAVVGVLAAFAFGYFLIPGVAERFSLALPALIVLVAVSVFGDLFESILKRTAGAKDSGRLLPGHGGILDRIDALIAVLPPMALLALSGLGA